MASKFDPARRPPEMVLRNISVIRKRYEVLSSETADGKKELPCTYVNIYIYLCKYVYMYVCEYV